MGLTVDELRRLEGYHYHVKFLKPPDLSNLSYWTEEELTEYFELTLPLVRRLDWSGYTTLRSSICDRGRLNASVFYPLLEGSFVRFNQWTRKFEVYERNT